MKKYISVLIAFLLAFSSITVVYAVKDANDVTLSMYCNRYDANEVTGKYKDNIFYLPAETLCNMIGGEVTAKTNKEINMALESVSRECEIVFSSETLTEPYIKDRKITMPCFTENGTVYISALHFLRYFGADVVLDKDNNPQLVVWIQYNIFDAVTDYVDMSHGYWFNWDEVFIEDKEIENELLNAGLVALINRESNFFRMMMNARGIEREALEEVLAVIVKNEGQEAFKESDVLLEETGLVNDFFGVYSGVLEILADEEMIEIPETFSTVLDVGSEGITAAINMLNAIDTMKQFENISETQKTLLDDTILNYKEDSAMLCEDWENVYKAAQNVDSRIQNDYNNKFAASCDMAEKTAFTYLDQLVGTNPVSLAWSSLIYTGKIIGSDTINQKTQLYNAYNCSMIQYIANELLVSATKGLNSNNYFYFNLSNQQQCLSRIKNSLILQLKSTLTTRQYLVKSDLLDASYLSDTEDMIREIAVLLNRVENCRIIPVGIEPEVDEDLTWMEDVVDTIISEETERSEQDLPEDDDSCYYAYEDVLAEYLAKWYSDGTYTHKEHCYHDIDEDGTNEMIIHDGTCEQDRTYYFYTYRQGEAILLGTVNAWHASLADSEKCLIISSGMGGTGDYYYIEISGEEVTQIYGGEYTFPPSPNFGENIIFMCD